MSRIGPIRRLQPGLPNYPTPTINCQLPTANRKRQTANGKPLTANRKPLAVSLKSILFRNLFDAIDPDAEIIDQAIL
jgi:hypothetical protein